MVRLLSSVLFSCVVIAFPRWGHARRVVVFPLDPRGVAQETANQATERVRASLSMLPDTEVVQDASVERQLRVRLIEQARGCEYDVFCLAQVGELLGSERILVGHVRRIPSRAPGGVGSEVELKLFVLDVTKTSVADALVWKVPEREGVLEEAAEAASRRLFSKPDAEIVLELDPPDAEVLVFGEALEVAKDGRLPFWSGRYHVLVRAEGRVPLEVGIVVPKGGPTRIPISLERDPLHVARRKERERSSPFLLPSRREGSGARGEDVAAIEGPREKAAPFSNLFAWGLIGSGTAALVAGIAVANVAQSEYNAISRESRYLPDVTRGATEAMIERDGARGRYRTGSAVAISGAIGAIAGAVWMIVDATSRRSPERSPDPSVKVRSSAAWTARDRELPPMGEAAAP